MASSDSQIDKPQRGCPKKAELPVVNINTGAQSINNWDTPLSINALRARIYYTALLGRPCCSLSIRLSLRAIFNTLFRVYIFSRESRQNTTPHDKTP